MQSISTLMPTTNQRKVEIGPLENEGTLVTKEMAKLLREQCKKGFSAPKTEVITADCNQL